MKPKTMPLPVARLAAETPYSPGQTGCPTDLRLNGNEGRVPSPRLMDLLAESGVECLRRYPDRTSLEQKVAGLHGLTAASVLVTAGADDALDRICRTYLEPGRNLVVAVPTFEMIPRYARLAGAEVRTAAWLGEDFPVAEILQLVDRDTGVIAVVSPNNPTGAVATAEDLRRLSAAAPAALLLVDLAYSEFAEVDLMPVALELPNAVATRSLSKAWGLAGLRVGYVAGPAELISPLRAAGGPYAVSGPSLLMAEAALEDVAPVAAFVATVQKERQVLQEELAALGAEPVPSQGNFVYARSGDPLWLRDGLAGLGIGIRVFSPEPGPGPVRISCPGNPADLERLTRSLQTVLAPQVLLFDMDGVLADVSGSYRQAIRETARHFGCELSKQEVAAAKRQPGSNNDWILTRQLLAERGVAVDLPDVIERFQAIYHQLCAGETLLPERGTLERLAARLPLAVVTGRPRADAETFLAHQGLTDLFVELVCMEDAPDKPDPAPVRLALTRLGAQRAWMVGDTVNDIVAARGAGVLPLGVVPPGEAPADYSRLLTAAGAGRVLANLSELEEVLPS